MTILGGRSRRKLRGVSLVVTHQDAWTTEWIIKQVTAGIEKAQGESCPVSIFVLSDDDVRQQIEVSPTQYEVIPTDPKAWIPRVFVALREADAVVISGVEANKAFAKNLKANILYLPILVDSLDQSPHFLPGHSTDLKRVARAARAIFFNSEAARSTAESVAPSMCERTQVLKPGSFKLKKKYDFATAMPNVIQPIMSLTPAIQEFLGGLHDLYREMHTPPRTVVTGSERDEQFFLNGEYGEIRFLPGIEFHSSRNDTLGVGPSITLVDDASFDSRLIEWSMKESLQLDAFPVSLSKVDKASLFNVVTGQTLLPGAQWAFPVPHTDGITLKKGIYQALRPNELTVAGEIKAVLAGSDFKFSSALLKELDSASDIKFVVDRAPSNSVVSRGRSTALAKWTDVVITEFLNEQAVWYSDNLPSNKRLIVHMHGYELYGSLADRINLDGVDQIVVPSEGYKAQVIEYRGWPETKLKVIPNSGSLDDLVRPKSPHAKFTLGLVGWVPSLKRIDRALDLLEVLISYDDRYALEVRGAPPWDYTWEWNTPAHRDTYIEVLRRLRSNTKLADHVTFSPFGPDVGNWLRGIGWMLSPSVRESFHLAPVEGMLSGAVPLVWERDGAADIFGVEWVLEDTSAVAKRVKDAARQEDGWETLSERAARDAAERYSDTISRRLWHEVIVNEESRESRREAADARNVVTPEQIRSVQLAERGDFLGAWEEIQRNGNLALQVSREYGIAHSAWVRGHVRLPNKLLARQHRTRKRGLSAPTNDRTILVQVAALGRETPRDIHGAATILLLKPPAGSPEADKYIPSYFVNFEPMVKILGADPTEAVTLEEHIQVIADQLIEEARATEAFNFRVDGPYWAVLAAIYAAIEVHGAVDWDLSQDQALNYGHFRPNPHVVTDDPLELSSIVLSQFVRNVMVDAHREIPTGLFEMFEAPAILSGTLTEKNPRESALDWPELYELGEDLPTVSIVLPSYRIDGSLIRTLDSIVRQTYPSHKIEVLIILNGQGVENKSLVAKYAHEHPSLKWHILESAPGVVPARNLGLDYATGEYLTFVDDDDLLERNYIASLTAMADANTVVAADMIDVGEQSANERDTNAVRRVKALGYERVPAYTRAGLFGACGGKIIPLELIGTRRFNPALSSGEDVEFLAGIVSLEEVGLISAHRMAEAAYVRTVSENSISRPKTLTAQFAVIDRLAVAYSVWNLLQENKSSLLVKSLEAALIRPQIRLLKQNLGTSPQYRSVCSAELSRFEEAFSEYVAALIQSP